MYDLKKNMIVQIAEKIDIPSWLVLAKEVEPLFGSLVEDPGFLAALDRNIQRQSAFCIREKNGQAGSKILAGLLFSMKSPEYKIGWLAVTEPARYQGLGKLLVRYALGLVNLPAEISVVTFDVENKEGYPARKFYKSLGFTPAEITEFGQDRSPRQVFRLKMN